MFESVVRTERKIAGAPHRLAIAAMAAILAAAGGCAKDSAPTPVDASSAPATATGSDLSVSPSPLDFGPVTSTATRTLRLGNTGTEDLTVTAVTACAPTSTEFAFTAPATPFVIAAGSTASVTVTYTAADLSGTDQACLRVETATAAQEVPLYADGITAADANGCRSCHGDYRLDPWTNGAPPFAARSSATSPSDVRVGAHQQHVNNGRLAAAAGKAPLSRPIHCKHCHPNPRSAGHNNGIKEIAWSGLASDGGSLAPALNLSAELDPTTGQPVSATCSSVYCHGATLAGGTNTTPIWNKVDGTQATCGSCHGVPPPSPHPQGAPGVPLDCGGCHEGYTATSVNVETHVDGVLDLKGGSCTACHGDENRAPAELAPAPPRSTSGATDTNDPGVGAHQAHLTGTTYRDAPIECTDCHVLPTDMSHATDATKLTFSNFAKDGLPAMFDPVTLRCSATYCHGGTLSGGSITAPVWNVVDGTQAACGTCHGLPPLTPHPANTNCGACHGPGYSLTTVNKATHLNALLELETSCTSCHGDASRPAAIAPAPPVDTAGNTATTAPGVGAHQAHLAGTRLRGTSVSCTDCHKVPADSFHSVRPLDLTFSDFVKTGGLTPRFDPSTTGATALTCSSTYCHGATLTGGTNKRPVWTGGAAQAQCGSCHGAPPPSPHPSSTACGVCHPGYSAGSVNAALHLDGQIQVNTSCTSCHGDPTRPATIAPAPPADTHGNVSNTAPGVGAHQAHLAGTRLSSTSVACTECHPIPTTTDHALQPLLLSWGPQATRDGALPQFNEASHTCASTYCHGATLSGGANTQPLWTGGVAQAQCSSCHGAPPPSPHPASTACGLCHPGYGSASVEPTTHLDGQLQVVTTCTSCHGDASRADAAIAPAPPFDTSGLATSDAVGAHQAHLTGTTLRASAIVCADCHLVPTTIDHAVQPLDLTWGPLAQTDGVSPTFDPVSQTCANYCHGATLSGGALTAPAWTDASAACGTCHGVPPPAPHPANPACGNCHTGYTQTSVNPASHLDGALQIDNLSCTSCHGSSARAAQLAAAPPVDTKGNTATSSRGVGAHQSHLTSTMAPAISCSDCHVKPTALAHPNGAVEVRFGALANLRQNATWNGTTCSTYCHGATLGSGTNHAPSWTTVNGTQDACGTCHGNPPSTGRHTSESEHRRACTDCHGGASATDPARHLNGKIELLPSLRWNATSRSCAPSCHGSESWGGSAAAPPGASITQTAYATPGDVDFGAVTTTATRTVTLRNLGTASLSITAIAPCSGTSSEFSVTPTGPATIAGGGALSLTVTYAPAAAGFDAGCISVTSNDAAHSPIKVTVTGTAAAPPTPPTPITPGTPGGLAASGATTSSLTLTWTAAADAASYELQLDTVSTFGSANLVTTKGIPGTATSTAVADLAANTTYYFRLRAISSTSTAGAYSGVATGTTASAATTTTTRRWQISNGTNVGGLTTNWSSSCGYQPNITSQRITTMTTSAFGCASDRLETTQPASASSPFNMLLLVNPTAYTASTTVRGTATGTTFSLRNSGGRGTVSFRFTLGYVLNGAFTALGYRDVTGVSTSTTSYTVNLGNVTGTAPTGSRVALRVSLISNTSGNEVRLYLGSSESSSGTVLTQP